MVTAVDSHCLSNLSMVFAEDSGILLPGKLLSPAVYKYSRLEYQQAGEPYTPYNLHILSKKKGTLSDALAPLPTELLTIAVMVC